jgi:hypothetical protein
MLLSGTFVAHEKADTGMTTFSEKHKSRLSPTPYRSFVPQLRLHLLLPRSPQTLQLISSRFRARGGFEDYVRMEGSKDADPS